MMKSKKGLFILSLLCFLFIPTIHAASTCDYETQVQLKKEAANVNGVYEAGWYGTGEFEDSEIEGHEPIEITAPEVHVNIYNITEDLYVVIKDNLTNSEAVYYYEDTDNGTLSWIREDIDNIVEYEVKVYSNHPDCTGEEIYKFNLKTPKYNKLSYEYYCVDQNDYYCQEFITQDVTIPAEEIQRIYEERKESQQTIIEEESKDNFFKKYFIYIIIGIVTLIGVAAIVMFIRKQRNKVI